MTINNIVSYVDALWDWGFLDECFQVEGRPTGIRVSDIDGIVERKGWFLLIEGKGPGKPVPLGQRRLFQELANKGFTILVIWGKDNEPVEMSVWYPHEKAPRKCERTDIGGIKDIVRRWFNWANGNGDVKRQEGAA